MDDPRVMNTADLEPALVSLRRARDASMDEGADGTDYVELDASIAAFEAEIVRRRGADDRDDDFRAEDVLAD